LSSENDIDAAFSSFVQRRVNAIFVGADAFFLSRRDQLVGLAARHAMPAIYHLRDMAVAGGLMSYGASLTDAYRLAGTGGGTKLDGARCHDTPGRNDQHAAFQSFPRDRTNIVFALTDAMSSELRYWR
jgi:putative tryptophan/tyrosine transport system substrate-binding protein